MAKKTNCPITRKLWAEYKQTAKPMKVVINDKEYLAIPKDFSTGSLGWNINDKVQVDVNGTLVTVQIGLNLTIVGSKDLPQDSPPASEPATA